MSAVDPLIGSRNDERSSVWRARTKRARPEESMRPIGVLLSLVIGVAACAPASRTQSSSSQGDGSMGLVFLTREGCTTTATMRANLDDALRSLGRASEYQVLDLDTLPEADARRGYPTPTLLYANRDVFGMAEPKPPFPEPA